MERTKFKGWPGWEKWIQGEPHYEPEPEEKEPSISSIEEWRKAIYKHVNRLDCAHEKSVFLCSLISNSLGCLEYYGFDRLNIIEFLELKIQRVHQHQKRSDYEDE